MLWKSQRFRNISGLAVRHRLRCGSGPGWHGGCGPTCAADRRRPGVGWWRGAHGQEKKPGKITELLKLWKTFGKKLWILYYFIGGLYNSKLALENLRGILDAYSLDPSEGWHIWNLCPFFHENPQPKDLTQPLKGGGAAAAVREVTCAQIPQQNQFRLMQPRAATLHKQFRGDAIFCCHLTKPASCREQLANQFHAGCSFVLPVVRRFGGAITAQRLHAT